ncbi:hypothetical protein GCM10010124_37090 [Pilimelia terevasa]|uniref:Uncharacterized protein n=1 Tax=Pilimelia terevasa TaxID=53372 RepID=A0A8J3BRN1_9ACTN|nr:hypothetical protein GCM10010124_37090 [Pilimelia terevasa]
MQGAGDVRRRDDHRERRPVAGGVRGEGPGGEPRGVAALLHLSRRVLTGQLHGRRRRSGRLDRARSGGVRVVCTRRRCSGPVAAGQPAIRTGVRQIGVHPTATGYCVGHISGDIARVGGLGASGATRFDLGNSGFGLDASCFGLDEFGFGAGDLCSDDFCSGLRGGDFLLGSASFLGRVGTAAGRERAAGRVGVGGAVLTDRRSGAVERGRALPGRADGGGRRRRRRVGLVGGGGVTAVRG